MTIDHLQVYLIWVWKKKQSVAHLAGKLDCTYHIPFTFNLDFIRITVRLLFGSVTWVSHLQASFFCAFKMRQRGKVSNFRPSFGLKSASRKVWCIHFLWHYVAPESPAAPQFPWNFTSSWGPSNSALARARTELTASITDFLRLYYVGAHIYREVS